MKDKQSNRRWPGALVQFALYGLAFYFIWQAFAGGPAPRQVSYTEFINKVQENKIGKVQVGAAELRGQVRQEAASGEQKKAPSAPEVLTAVRPPDLEDAQLLPLLREKGVEVVGRVETVSWWSSLLFPFLPILLLIGFYLWSYRRFAGQGAEALNLGKNRAKIYDRSSEHKVTFDDVAGVEEAEAELVEVVDFLKNPAKYQRLGGRIPRGVLLVGPPGTGKTLLARAAAFGGHDEREQTLNQLLVEMDGFDSSKAVIIMAATNRPEVLDPALLRPGRFDRQVVVDRPDVRGREEILKVHAARVKLAGDVDLSVIAARTPGMSGADLANILNESALLASRRGADAVEMRDLEEAIDRVTLGLERRSRVMSPEEKRRVAYHEIGHALTALSVEHADPVHRVTIIPRSIGALGATLQLPTAERYLLTKPELDDRLAVMLGGRAAEEIVFDGVVSTGAHNDLERATEMARQMVTRYGMSERLGHMTFGRPVTGQFLESTMSFGEERNFSERTAELIDEEVKRLIDETYARVRETLSRRRAALDRVAEVLQRRETIGREELESITAEASPLAAAGKAS